MFHLAIVFMPVLLLGLGIAIIATLLTGLGLLLAALTGGASVALLVQDKSLKRLLLLGCGVLALAGIACGAGAESAVFYSGTVLPGSGGPGHCGPVRMQGHRQ